MALKSTLSKIAAALPRACDIAAEGVARVVEAVATAKVAVDTGAARTSIEVFGAAGTGERIVQAGQSLGYVQFLEYGTSKQVAQPFFTPAAFEAEKQLLPITKAAVIDAIK